MEKEEWATTPYTSKSRSYLNRLQSNGLQLFQILISYKDSNRNLGVVFESSKIKAWKLEIFKYLKNFKYYIQVLLSGKKMKEILVLFLSLPWTSGSHCENLCCLSHLLHSKSSLLGCLHRTLDFSQLLIFVEFSQHILLALRYTGNLIGKLENSEVKGKILTQRKRGWGWSQYFFSIRINKNQLKMT